MITDRLRGIHLAIGLRLETSLWIILIGCLKLQKFIIQGRNIFFTVAWGEGGGVCGLTHLY